MNEVVIKKNDTVLANGDVINGPYVLHFNTSMELLELHLSHLYHYLEARWSQR